MISANTKLKAQEGLEKTTEVDGKDLLSEVGLGRAAE